MKNAKNTVLFNILNQETIEEIYLGVLYDLETDGHPISFGTDPIVFQ